MPNSVPYDWYPSHIRRNIEEVETEPPVSGEFVEELRRRFDIVGERWVQLTSRPRRSCTISVLLQETDGPMKITDVTTTILDDPNRRPLQDSTVPDLWKGGGSEIFVHLKTDEGTEGLGVSSARPPHAIRSIVERELKDLLIGQDPFNIEKLWNDMFWRVRNYGRKGVAFQALSAVDIGLWDLKAKALGLPLYRLLNPRFESVPIYGSGGWTNLTEQELVEEMTGFVEWGIPRVKMKVGMNFGQAERQDIQRLAAVRKAVGDDVEIYVDANMGYTVKQAIRMSRIFQDYDVRWFEEPVLADNVEGLAEISRATEIPVATGENEYTRHGFEELIVHGGPTSFNRMWVGLAV